jgi:hypothetical protein
MAYLVIHPKIGNFFSDVADPRMCVDGVVIIDTFNKKQLTDGENWVDVPNKIWVPDLVQEEILRHINNINFVTKKEAISIAEKCISINKLNPILDICFRQNGRGLIHRHQQSSLGGVVYFLIDNNEVVYIGQTITRDRILAHRDKKFDSFLYTPICLDQSYLIVEELLIDKFTTKYNSCQVSKRKHSRKHNIDSLISTYNKCHPFGNIDRS